MDSKNALKSMTVQGLIVLALLHFLPMFGVKWDDSQVGSVADDILTIAAVTWAFIGRLRASTKLILAPQKTASLLLLVLLIPMPLMVFGTLFCLYGCAGKSIPDTTIRAIGMDVGYAVYRLVPESRPVLSSICLLSDINDATLLKDRLKESLGKIWTSANSMTSQDGQMVVLGVNNLVGTLDLYLANAKAEQAVGIAKNAIAGICDGEARASSS